MTMTTRVQPATIMATPNLHHRPDNKTVTLKVISYNMHGFQQGCPAIEDIINDENPDIFMLQENWLTPSNLCNFESRFSDYFAFGCSAMASRLESGMLRGRPFGGIMTLISKTLRKQTVTIHCEERFSVVKVFNRLFINVYLPCSGSIDRVEVYNDLLADIWSWRERYSDCECSWWRL